MSSPASPCTGVCRLDARTGWCVGCLRTMNEISRWGQADDAERAAILRALPNRRAGA